MIISQVTIYWNHLRTLSLQLPLSSTKSSPPHWIVFNSIQHSEIFHIWKKSFMEPTSALALQHHFSALFTKRLLCLLSPLPSQLSYKDPNQDLISATPVKPLSQLLVTSTCKSKGQFLVLILFVFSVAIAIINHSLLFEQRDLDTLLL